MRVLVLGASGMLGHKVAQQLAPDHQVWGTIRDDRDSRVASVLGDDCRGLLGGVDAGAIDRVAEAVATVRPDAVVNCIGVIKQAAEASDPVTSVQVNALFPHQLARICGDRESRLVHFSTDCVFRGDRGLYDETHPPDAIDLYGRTKALGEVRGRGCLTLRTSIVGRELRGKAGLLEWFLSNRGRRIKGYRGAVFSGFPTVEIARVLSWILERQPGLHGTFHVASAPIDKYDLLVRLRDALEVDIDIEPIDEPRVDRSLDGRRFNAATGFAPRAWDELVATLAEDARAYETGGSGFLAETASADER